ncbi:hypothetical protein [Gluconobacter kondonii]|uniref:hypothetical protein n=1 Tax=Gluconobacter kondonii TaxID=941463 RepID=UPI001B8CE4F9|nr:hypothetical protein [Gluconobacter kondonii]MBS1082329.1 hypothetical protein [Gluconobacter kondonii]
MSQLPAGATLIPDEDSASLPAGATLLPDDHSSDPGILSRAWSAEKGVLHTDNQVARSMAEGIPVIGGLLNKADAGADALLSYGLNPLFSKDQQLQGSLGDRYRQALAAQNGMDQQFHQAHPVADIAAHVAGGVLGGVAGARLMAPAMAGLGISTAPGLGGVAVRAATGATGGAGIGAADAEVRGQDARRSAVLGALLGGGGSAIGDGLGAALRPIVSGPAERARSVMQRLGEADAITQVGADAELGRLGPSGFIGDLGPNMQQALRMASSAPGAAQKQIAEALVGRANTAGARVTDALDSALGPRTNVLETADQIAAERARQAAPLYEAAYKADVPMTPDLQEILTRPSVEKAYNAAHRLASDAGEAFDMGKPNVMALDYTKRALDDAISNNLRAGNNNEARILIGNRNAIVDHLDAHVPEYAAARRVFSDQSRIATALEDGQAAFKNTQSPDALSRALAGMSDTERSAYQEGARQQVTDIMGTARNDANAARSLLDKGYNREKLDLLIGAEPAARVNNAIDAERTFAATNQAARGGSMTDRNLLAQQIIPGADAPPVLRSLLNFKIGDALYGAADRVARPAIEARNSQTRSAIADALLSRDTSLFAPATPRLHALSNPVAAALLGANQNGPR